MPVRDLTLEELEEAQFLARRIAKIEGASEFTSECEALARNGVITRGQFEFLRRKIKVAKRPAARKYGIRHRVASSRGARKVKISLAPITFL